MQPLASQSSTAAANHAPALSTAPMVETIATAPGGQVANDNTAAWKPTLLVLRRRRLSRRANRS